MVNMHRLRTFTKPLPLLLLLGCSEPFDTPEVPDPDSGTDEPDTLLSSLDGTGCEDFDGTPLAGGATYFYGRYVGDAGGYTGEERWIILANDVLESGGQPDCEVVWATTAEVTDPGACGGCEMGLGVSASLDPGETTCPEEFYTGDESFSVTYGIQQQGNGAISWYFAGSGAHLADGESSSGVLTFLTEKSCAWF